MRDNITLLQLNQLVQDALKYTLPDSYWIRAEIIDVRQASSGHCYFEFVQKDESSGAILAKASGRIWASTNRVLQPMFERESGHRFVSGIKVLTRVSVDFHPQYGFSLTVLEIDPSFTLGDLMRQRREILQRLEQESLLELNRSVKMPILPRRVAVISSVSAAGYEDFTDQLSSNIDGFKVYTHIFPALMQGPLAATSISMALTKVSELSYLFDILVIIRGGGATSDLNCFDSYELGAAVAKFPIPVVVGIGHERDSSVLDVVAHTSVKTPTAAAEFILQHFSNAQEYLMSKAQILRDSVLELLNKESAKLLQITNSIHRSSVARIHTEQEKLSHYRSQLQYLPIRRVESDRTKISLIIEQIRGGSTAILAKENLDLALKLKIVELSSPQLILERGYVYVTQGGKSIKEASDMLSDNEAELHFKDGVRRIRSID
ncbi:MAG: exodeoxyribonuclease VII large subunit [Bacteroidales bacterium]